MEVDEIDGGDVTALGDVCGRVTDGPNPSIHWGRVTHICVGNLTIIGSDNGLSPGRRQAIIRTNAGMLLIGPLRTNFSEILIGIQAFSLKKIHLKMSSASCCSFRLGLNVLSGDSWPKLALAPCGARPSAGTMLDNIKWCGILVAEVHYDC